jgi:hypothetical protein
MVTLRLDRVSHIEQLFHIMWFIPCIELVEVLPCFPKGWYNPRPACISNISLVEITIMDLRSIRREQAVSQDG